MSLHLDARQRAMLQEMGVTVWARAQAAAAPDPMAVPAPLAAPATPATPATPAATQAALAARPAAARPVAAAPAPTPATAQAPAAAWRLREPLALYPAADPALTPAELGSGWLIVAESPTPADPLAGEVGALLNNMLRALQLHRHPRTFLCVLERTTSATSGGAGAADALATAVAQLQPAMVLVLGYTPARAALGRHEPLGRLRAEPHQVATCPAVVTYDPGTLLRSPDIARLKAATWADLCRALTLVRGGTGG